MSTKKSAYTCRVLDFSTDRQAVGQLRYEVFVERLGWVPGDPVQRLELDELDEHATHIGAFDVAGRLVGYVRVIRGGAPSGMLLQKPAFAKLMPDHLDTSPRTAEVSRLCLRLITVPMAEVEEILVGLYRAIYQFVVLPSLSSDHPIGMLYATANDKNAGYMNAPRLWRIGFTTLAGPVQLNGDKIETQLLGLDLPQAFRNPQFRAMLGI